MTWEHVAIGLTSVDPPSTVALMVGGFLMGALVLWLVPAVSAPGHVSMIFVSLVLGMLGLVFFIARGTALFIEGNPVWPRTMFGFPILWIAFAGSIAAGIETRRRMARR